MTFFRKTLLLCPIIFFLSCTERTYYSRIVEGRAIGVSDPVPYEIILAVSHKSEKFHIFLNTEEAYEYLKPILDFTNKLEFKKLLETILRKKKTIELDSNTYELLVNNLHRKVQCCGDSSKINFPKSRLAHFINIETNQINNSITTKDSDFNWDCFRKSLLENKAFIYYNTDYYGELNIYYFLNFKDTKKLKAVY